MPASHCADVIEDFIFHLSTWLGSKNHLTNLITHLEYCCTVAYYVVWYFTYVWIFHSLFVFKLFVSFTSSVQRFSANSQDVLTVCNVSHRLSRAVGWFLDVDLVQQYADLVQQYAKLFWWNRKRITLFNWICLKSCIVILLSFFFVQIFAANRFMAKFGSALSC